MDSLFCFRGVFLKSIRACPGLSYTGKGEIEFCVSEQSKIDNFVHFVTVEQVWLSLCFVCLNFCLFRCSFLSLLHGMNTYSSLDDVSAPKVLYSSVPLSTSTGGITLERSADTQQPPVAPLGNDSSCNNVAIISTSPKLLPPLPSQPTDTRDADATEMVSAVPAAPAAVILKSVTDSVAVENSTIVETSTQPAISRPILMNVPPTSSALVSSPSPSAMTALAESIMADNHNAQVVPNSSSALTTLTKPVNTASPTTSITHATPTAIAPLISPTTKIDPLSTNRSTASTTPVTSTPAVVSEVAGPRTTKTVTVETERHTVRVVEDTVPPNTSAASSPKVASANKMMSEAIRQAYIFLSESNRQELRKIARRWHCRQGVTKGILVARLVMFVYERVEKLKACQVGDVLGAVEAWGFNAFLAQWESVHSKKSVASLDTLEKLAKSNSKTEIDAMLPQLPRVDGKRKWRRTRLRERERSALSNDTSCVEPSAKRRVGRPPKNAVKIPSLATTTKAMLNATANETSIPIAPNTNFGSGMTHNPNIPSLLSKPSHEPLVSSLAAIARESTSLEKVHEKLEEVSGQVAQFMNSKPIDKDPSHSSKEPARISDDSIEAGFEKERKLLLELKKAKHELANAKGDEELEKRWTNLVKRIRKKLDELSTIDSEC